MNTTERFEWLQIGAIYSDAATYLTDLGLPPLPSLLSPLTTAIWTLGDPNRIKGALITSIDKPRITLLTFTRLEELSAAVCAAEEVAKNRTLKRYPGKGSNVESIERQIEKFFGLKQAIHFQLKKPTQFEALSDIPFSIDFLDYFSLLMLSHIDQALEAYISDEADHAIKSFKEAAFLEQYVLLSMQTEKLDTDAWDKNLLLAVRRTRGSPLGAAATKAKAQRDHEFIRQFATSNFPKRKWNTRNQAINMICAKLEEDLLIGNVSLPSGKKSISEGTVRTALKPWMASQSTIFSRSK